MFGKPLMLIVPNGHQEKLKIGMQYLSPMAIKLEVNQATINAIPMTVMRLALSFSGLFGGLLAGGSARQLNNVFKNVTSLSLARLIAKMMEISLISTSKFITLF